MEKRKSGYVSMVAVLLVTLLSVPLLTGCSDDDDIPAEIIAVWQLQSFILDSGTTTDVDDPSKYTVEFKSDGNADIRSDCNSCSGRYFVDGNDLRFGTLACTLAECGAGSFDTQFQAALSTVSMYEIVDGPLFLNYEGGQMRLTPAPALF